MGFGNCCGIIGIGAPGFIIPPIMPGFIIPPIMAGFIIIAGFIMPMAGAIIGFTMPIIGAIMGVEGSCDTTNYTKLTEPDQNGWFQVQEVASGTVTEGVTGSLGLVDANFHVLTAGPQGAKLVDVFTFFSKRAGSRSLDVAEKPRDAEARVYEAAWRQPRRRRG